MRIVSYFKFSPQKKDLLNLALIVLFFSAIYYPIFFYDYLYSDEANQLWLTDQNVNLTSVAQGRLITYFLFKTVFGFIHSVKAVKYARILAFLGWTLCLPIWYFILKKLFQKNGLPSIVTSLSCCYLISMPSFTISIAWSACLEMFLACTAGLISGYMFERSLERYNNERKIFFLLALASLSTAMVSLFTYQNGFGCFFIPLFINLLARFEISKKTIISIGWGLFLYLVYYGLFKLSLSIINITASDRVNFAFNPWTKIVFFFSRPLAASFHFTLLFDEKSIIGITVSVVTGIVICVLLFIKIGSTKYEKHLLFICSVLITLFLAYLPSLITYENYSSNRTLLSLNFLVFLLSTHLVCRCLKGLLLPLTAGVLIILFCINAWYNLRYEFILPLNKEFADVKKELRQNFTENIDTVIFIRPAESLFMKKYGIVQSWDEFGIPSTAKIWVPEPLVKQLVFEMTRSRERGDRLIVLNYNSEADISAPSLKAGSKTTIIDATKRF